MNAALLSLLVVTIAALLCLGAVAAVWPRQARWIVWGAAGVAGFAAGLAVLDLQLAEPSAVVALPMGLAGVPFRLALDPLAAFFAALLFGSGAATLAFVAASEKAPAATAIPVCLGLLGIAVLGADGFTRGAGLALAGTAIWMSGPADRSGIVQLGVALLAGAAVIAAAEAPPQVRFWAALIGPGTLAGLLPLHRWIEPANGASTHAAALMYGAGVPTALYVMLRLLFEPNGAVPSGWWGLLLSLLGAAAGIIGGLDATRAHDLDTALAAGTTRQTGLVTLGLGIALTAGAEDLPAVTAMALAAALLLAALQAIAGTLQALSYGAIRDGAGTRRLDRLGGLVHRMPTTTVCLLAGLTGLAAVPISAGFAAAWLLLHAALGLPHAATLPSQLLRCGLVAALGLASALGAAGLVRLVGVVCLGRPRTPRAAVAEEPSRAARLVLMTLAFVATAWGVLVGPLLILFVDAPMRVLIGSGLGLLASPLGLSAAAGSSGYGALPIACLVAAVAGVVIRLRRLMGVPEATVSSPAWEDGFAAPPAWLPFGDPSTQTAGTDFSPAFARLCGMTAVSSRVSAQAGHQSALVPAPAAARHGTFARLANFWLPPAGSAPAILLALVAGILILCTWAGAT